MPTVATENTTIVKFSDTLVAIQKQLQNQATQLAYLENERTNQTLHNSQVISRLDSYESMSANIAKSITDALSPSISCLVTRAVEAALLQTAIHRPVIAPNATVTPLKTVGFASDPIRIMASSDMDPEQHYEMDNYEDEDLSESEAATQPSTPSTHLRFHGTPEQASSSKAINLL